MSVNEIECGQGVEEIENSELRKISDDILGSLKYSMSIVASDSKLKVKTNSVEQDFKTLLKTYKPEKLALIKKRASSLVKMPVESRELMFGRVGVLDKEAFLAKGGVEKVGEFMEATAPLRIDPKLLGIKVPELSVPLNNIEVLDNGLLIPSNRLPKRFSDFESVEAEVTRNLEILMEEKIMNETKMADIWGVEPDMEQDLDTPSTDDFEEQGIYNGLSLYIKRIKCVDETNPEWWGHDEIALAGIEVDETGDTKKISERYIRGGFDDGESKRYNPHWRYTYFNINEGGNRWPKKYTVTYILAEKDHGGLGAFLHKLWSKVKKMVVDAIAKGVSALLSIPEIIAKIIVNLIMRVVNMFVDWFIGLFSDDIFRPQFATCKLYYNGQRFYHRRGDYRTYSRTYTTHFYGYGGHYLLDYYWKLV